MILNYYISNMSIEALFKSHIVFQKDDPSNEARLRLMRDYKYPPAGLGCSTSSRR